MIIVSGEAINEIKLQSMKTKLHLRKALLLVMFLFATFVSFSVQLNPRITNYKIKLALVLNNSGKVIRLFWMALKFVAVKFFGAYTLALLLLVSLLILLWVYTKTGDSIEMTSGVIILIVFLVQQIYVWLRVAGKVWFLSSQFEYYLMNNRED